MSDRPAILGGTPVSAASAWPSWPQWAEDERSSLLATLESGAWSSSKGDRARTWAAEFASFQGAPHGLPLTNGTHTLEAALAACGIGEGDEVIVPAITFVASASAALAVNATPRIVDVDPQTLCIDPAAAEAAISDRSRALIAVHIAGRACDMDALVSLCERHGLHLVEDCAHAPGSRWRGRGVGGFGAFGSFSFEASKLITAGEGGALITADETLRERAWSYVNCGRVEGGHWYHHPNYGSNLRMTEWQGALLSAQLRRYPAQLSRREQSAALLDAAIAEIPGLRPQPGDDRMDAWARYAYVIHYEPQLFAGLSPAGLEAAIAAEGIEVGGCYPPLHRLDLFREANFGPRLRNRAPTIDYGRLDLPNADRAATSIWLPHRLLLAEPEDLLLIPQALSRIQRQAPAIVKQQAAGPLRSRLGAARRRLRARRT